MKLQGFKTTRFILTEGFEDTAFAKAMVLTTARNLPDFDIAPNDSLGAKAGNNGFEDAIIGAGAVNGFTAIRDVVLIGDNDDNHAAAFESVRQQIVRANQTGLARTWAVPDRPGEKAEGDPSVSIWMWPEPGVVGCLETLLWRVIVAKHAGIAGCVDAAMHCAEADQWTISKRDKARVRCFLTLYCRKNPVVRFDILWRDFKDVLPTNRKELTPFANFLRSI